MSLVARMYNKIAPEYGCSPVYHRIHHKNSVKKLVAIGAIAIVPWKNHLQRGGMEKKLYITRCGGKVKATKDFYPRVYTEDGSYTYPRLPENQLRKKGSLLLGTQDSVGGTKSQPYFPHHFSEKVPLLPVSQFLHMFYIILVLENWAARN